MKFKKLLKERFEDVYIDKKRTVINVIKILRWKNVAYQRKIYQIIAYKVMIPKMDSYYTDYEIYAKPVKSSSIEKKYEFYIASIGYKFFNEELTLKEFYDKFMTFSKHSIDYHIDGYREDNRDSGIYGDVRSLNPGIYPKNEKNDNELPF